MVLNFYYIYIFIKNFILENDEYSAIVKEIEDIDSQIARLTSRRKFLLERKQKLKDEEIFKKQLQISTKDWIKDGRFLHKKRTIFFFLLQESTLTLR